jgi:methionyl-tRNA formyltransferase
MALQVGILTSIDRGVASHHLNYLMRHPSDAFEIVCAIQVTQAAPRSSDFWKRKIKKIARIGVLGALNGMRMRSWFGRDVADILSIAPLQEACTRHGVQLHEVQQLNSAEMKDLLHQLELDVVISLGNGFIAPSVFNIPQDGMLNIHHELLPEFRNAQSVIWQLHRGSSTTGYTIHRIAREIDAGEILYQETIPISFETTLAKTVSQTIGNVWDASAVGLRKTLVPEIKTHAEYPEGQAGHYTTPSLIQFLRIVRNWKKLKQELN